MTPCGAPYGVTYLIPAEPYYRRVLDDLKKETQALLTYPCTLKCRESWAGISYTPQYLAYEAMETSAGPLRSVFLISYQRNIYTSQDTTLQYLYSPLPDECPRVLLS